MIWWFIGGTAGHPCLKSNHQRVQVWIQHQKFTHRSFYIKSLIKINRSSFADEQGKFLSTKKECCRHDMLNFLVDDLFAPLHSPAIHTVQWPKMQKCYVNANFLQKPSGYWGVRRERLRKMRKIKNQNKFVFSPSFYVNMTPVRKHVLSFKYVLCIVLYFLCQVKIRTQKKWFQHNTC